MMTRLAYFALAASLLACLGAPPASAESRAEKSFKAFAATWMVKLNKGAERTSKGSTSKSFSEPALELKPTGHPKAPYVGIIRYKEQTYRCNRSDKNCAPASVTPVTEIFRFQGGKWVY